MKTPPLLLGMTLIFWGWQTSHPVLGIIIALLLEGSHLIKMRWDLSSSDFNRISDLCSLIFVGMFIYFYVSRNSARAALVMFQWVPVALLPLMLAQVYGGSERIEVSALFLLFRKKKVRKEADNPFAMNLSYPYFALCVLSASAANLQGPWFYPGLFILAGWALFSVRSKRFPLTLWVSLLLLTGAAGYLGHHALHDLQMILEKKTIGWFTNSLQKDRDPYKASTAIGDVGELKLSDRILLRVRWKSGKGKSLLLRDASYNAYRASTWFALHPRFKGVRVGPDKKTWQLNTSGAGEETVTVTQYLQQGKGMLKLPMGTWAITNLPAMRVFKNRFGAVEVEGGPGLVQYRLKFNPSRAWDSAPDEMDLEVPDREKPAVERIVGELGLRTMPHRRVLKILSAFFDRHFTYSLSLENRGGQETALGNFLLHTRSGHCEYFATATVLLLRAAGIPARYATGYVVREFSPMENCFVVRARHAHAWALAYVNGAWRDFDTTPPSWFAQEQEASSALEPLTDMWSWLVFQYSRWRWSEGKGGWVKYLGWLLVPLILLLGRRPYKRRRVKRTVGKKAGRPGTRTGPGMDSAFYVIERKLIECGYERRPWEPLSNWVKRIGEESCPGLAAESLEAILALHYRYRFDPKGITEEERQRLGASVRDWLAENEHYI